MDKEVQVISSKQKMRSNRSENKKIITVYTVRTPDTRAGRRRHRSRHEGQYPGMFAESEAQTRLDKYERRARLKRQDQRLHSERHHGDRHHQSEHYAKRSRFKPEGSSGFEALSADTSGQSTHRDYEFMFLQPQRNKNYPRKHSSDISDYVSNVATETEIPRQTGVLDLQQSSSEDNGLQRLSVSDSNLRGLEIRAKTGSRCGHSVRAGEICITCKDQIRNILQPTAEDYENNKTNKHRARIEDLERKISKLYFCGRERKGPRKTKQQLAKASTSRVRAAARGSQTCCRKMFCPLNKRKEKKPGKKGGKIPYVIKLKESPLPSGSSSQSLSNVTEPQTASEQLSEILNQPSNSSGRRVPKKYCRASICPPCGLCLAGCNALKRSSAEERQYLRREASRCDCKQKLLRQRLLIAFDVCLKCRLPKHLCHCLEDMILEYKRNNGRIPKGSSDDYDSDYKEDPLSKLLYEVTNTCPKCGRWRKDCVCLEEILKDVKRMLKVTKRNAFRAEGCCCAQNASRMDFANLGNNKTIDTDTSRNICPPYYPCGCGARKRSPRENLPRVSRSRSRSTKRQFCRQCCSGTRRDTTAYSFTMDKNESCAHSQILTVDGTSEMTDSNACEEICQTTPIKAFCSQCRKSISLCKCRVSSSMNICNYCKLPEIMCECRNSASPHRTGAVSGKKERSRNEYRHQHEINSGKKVQKLPGSEKSKATRYTHPTEKFRSSNQPDDSRTRTVNASFQIKSDVQLDCHLTTSSSVSLSVNPRSTAHAELILTDNKYANVASSPPSGENSSEKKKVYTNKEDYNMEQIAYEHELRVNNNMCVDNFKCDDKIANSSQSAFQKFKSHFRRCRSCGKKHAKKKLECTQTQCNYVTTVLNASEDGKDDKHKKKKRKEIKEGKKRTMEMENSKNDNKVAQLVDVILPPKRRTSNENLPNYRESLR